MGRQVGETPAAIRAQRSAATALTRPTDQSPTWPLGFLAGTNCYVYTGQLSADGEYRQRFSGPGIETLLGGPLPAGADPADVWLAAVHPDDRARYARATSQARRLAPLSMEYRLVGRDDVVRWVLDRSWPWPSNPDGSIIYDGVVTDVTELHSTVESLQNKLRVARAANLRLARARAAAERRARTDELTGLANRRHLTAMLTERLDNPSDGDRGLGLLLIDIDFFKQINDDLGHAAGDELLTAFAERLRASTRSCDLTARWGGEEFVMLLPGVSEPAVVARRAEQIRACMANAPFRVNGELVTIHVSVGAVFADGSTHDPDQLLLAVDEAMYAAKRAGRNQVALSLDRSDDAETTAPDEQPSPIESSAYR